MSILKRCISGW